MRTGVSLALACLFVFLAGFNVWSMLTARGGSAARARFWIQIHRVAGYLFIALFAIFSYFMLRIKGSPDELSPRIILHMGLALLLAPLLFVKVIVARYQKAARGLLTALGIGIFTIAFTLVALNVSVHYLRDAPTHRVPLGTSMTVVILVTIAAAVGFSAKVKQPNAKPTTSTLGQPSRREPRQCDEPLHLTLARIDSQTHDAKPLRFLLPRGQQIAMRPGQFLTFEWMIDGKPVTRSYSICSSPLQSGHIEITPKRVENGCVSQFLNDRAAVGLTVKARGPHGKFCFDESQHRRIVLIAGGSGITPMMSMLRYIDDLCITADVTLIYCVRTEQDIFFKDELAVVQRRSSQFRYVLVLSQPGAEWQGWKGRLRREILEREVPKFSESTFFLCGPPPFMDTARALLRDMAVDPSRILQESFGSAVARDERFAATTGSREIPLEIKFARSAVTCSLSANETVLESSERNGVLLPSGCRQGVCGTCATRLLSGTVDMERQDALTEEMRAQGFILPCVSRPLSDITLDA